MSVTFPPLLTGDAVLTGTDPFDQACAKAALGCDGGTVLYDLGQDILRVAIVFAPEMDLSKAMSMLPVCAVGFQNALGALAPPEVAVHVDWGGGIRVNGALCGRFRAAASAQAPRDLPDWLVIGLELRLWPEHEDGGITPDQTALFSEGCADVAPDQLLESYTRHMLVWLNRWEQEGAKPLHSEWRGIVHGMGEEIEILDRSGTFMGVDEEFGLLLRGPRDTTLIPLTQLLEDAS